MLRNPVKYHLITMVLALIYLSPAHAQKTEIWLDPDFGYKNALELFDKEKYVAAQNGFEDVIQRIDNPNDEIQVNAEYYHAVCALELFNKDTEFLLQEFVRKHPESPRVKVARFQLGRYYYRKKKYRDALEWFEQVDEYDLSNRELAEFYFKKGYAYFRTGKDTQASRLFYEIKSTETEYKEPALYFYSHIAYKQDNFQTALEGFEQLKSHPGFGKVVPYYIAQIYYMQGHYDDLISYAGPLIDTARVKREGEISKLIGEAYFRTDRYKKAVPFLESYVKKSANVTREDRYQLAYALYKAAQYEEAVQYFNLVTTKEDPTSQAAYYNMGDSYLQMGKKANARNAFKAASEMRFDVELRENALYNYAKLSFELDYDPFNQAIGAFEEYLNSYPASDKREEVYDFLLNVYLKTKSYDKALESLDKITNKDMRLQTTYQVVAFNSGVQHFTQKDFPRAMESFTKVMTYPVDNSITNSAIYWTGECYYELGEYENAIVQYEKFKAQPGAILNEHYNRANYNIGYAHVKKTEYSKAVPAFRTFAQRYNAEDKHDLNDAYLRIGDCFYMQRRYNDAVDYYGRALDIRLMANDYAYYQQAICYGLLKKQDQKERALKKALAEFPESNYIVMVKYELGEVYRKLDRSSEAIRHYQMVVDDHVGHPKVVKAKTNIGYLKYRAGQKSEGIAILKQVCLDATSYAEAADALNLLEDVYAAEGTPEKYVDLIGQLAYFNAGEGKVDSLTYQAAELHYFNGDCGKAISGMTNYINKYPNGIFAMNAYYYRADCNIKAGRKEQALTDLKYIIDRHSSRFTEDALMWSSQINFELGRWQAAINNYQALETMASMTERVLYAQLGMMRSYAKLGKCQMSRTYASKVIANDLSTDDYRYEARMIKGRCFLRDNRTDDAFKEFKIVANGERGQYGAEAKYQMAYIWFLQDNYEKCDEQVKDLLNNGPASDHWIAMSFLLLAETSIAEGDFFQAKATLQSIIDHHDGPELVRKAQERLDWIIEQENKATTAPEGEDFEIDINGNSNDGQRGLFEEDENTPRRRNRGGTDNGGESPNLNNGGGNR